MADTVMIALPAGELARFTDTASSLMTLERPEGSEFFAGKGLSIPENLNTLAKHFMATTHEWLFLVNDDHLYEPKTLMRLLARDVSAVTALVLKKKMPFAPAIYDGVSHDGQLEPVYLTRGLRGLVPIRYCGDGGLMLRRRVLEAIPDPWWEAGSPRWSIPDQIRHDLVFCDKVHAAGVQLYCDLDVVMGHIAVMPIIPRRDPISGEWQTMLNAADGQALLVPPAKSPRQVTLR